MIKRPGNESYLRKMIEVERRAFSEVLEITRQSSQTETDSSDSETDGQL